MTSLTSLNAARIVFMYCLKNRKITKYKWNISKLNFAILLRAFWGFTMRNFKKKNNVNNICSRFIYLKRSKHNY